MLAGLTQFSGRLLPARPDLAASHLRGSVRARRYADGLRHSVSASLLDLLARPDRGAGRATQLLHGEAFVAYEVTEDGFAWGQAENDGYVGYVDAGALGRARAAGHRVQALWSHIYPTPDMKAPPRTELPFLAEVPVSGTTGGFARLRGGGHVPRPHLVPHPGDWVSQAERFVGTPYLWGGRSARGLDCSALIQLALMSQGFRAPRDSDMQAAALGAPIPADLAPERGDLVFWKGHVGVMLDPELLLHANAHHMAVAVEPLATACERIENAGGGKITERLRMAEPTIRIPINEK